MDQEFETRILNINKTEIIRKLEKLGAKKIKNVLQKRKTFDYPDRRLEDDRAWIRLRDNGDGKVTLAYKCHQLDNTGGVPDCAEVEFDVPDLNKPEQFLLLLGLKRKSYQETKRTRYQINDLQFDIDEWPMINPFVEIEGSSKERVEEGVKMLGHTMEDTFQGHAGDIYEKEGIDWRSMKNIVF